MAYVKREGKLEYALYNFHIIRVSLDGDSQNKSGGTDN